MSRVGDGDVPPLRTDGVVTQRVEHVVVIAASPGDVWRVLTTPALMTSWMGEPEMQLEIDTDWRVGAPVEVRGVHHVAFRNTGTVLRVDPGRALAYTHLSSLSRLPDTPENHTEIAFALAAAGEGTSLTLTLSRFPTESIARHLDFYWRTTLGILKQAVERNVSAPVPIP